MRKIVFISALIFTLFQLRAQTDSTEYSDLESDSIAADTVKPKKKWDRPRKAMWLSAALPGLGQVYNKKNFYWKLPILYGSYSVIYYFFRINSKGYRKFDDQYDMYFDLQESDPQTQVFYIDPETGFRYTTLSQIKTERDNYRRYRDMCIFFGLSLYALNIMDAYVEAHLLDFDISPDLSMKVEPVFLSGNNVSFAPGLSVQLRFKSNTRFNHLIR